MKHCRACGENNPDDRIFCSACGEPLNSDLQLLMDLDKMTANPSKGPSRARVDDDSDDYVPRTAPKAKKKKKSAAPWVILAILVIVVVAVLVLK